MKQKKKQHEEEEEEANEATTEEGEKLEECSTSRRQERVAPRRKRVNPIFHSLWPAVSRGLKLECTEESAAEVSGQQEKRINLAAREKLLQISQRCSVRSKGGSGWREASSPHFNFSVFSHFGCMRYLVENGNAGFSLVSPVLKLPTGQRISGERELAVAMRNPQSRRRECEEDGRGWTTKSVGKKSGRGENKNGGVSEGLVEPN